MNLHPGHVAPRPAPNLKYSRTISHERQEAHPPKIQSWEIFTKPRGILINYLAVRHLQPPGEAHDVRLAATMAAAFAPATPLWLNLFFSPGDSSDIRRPSAS